MASSWGLGLWRWVGVLVGQPGRGVVAQPGRGVVVYDLDVFDRSRDRPAERLH